MRYRLIVWDFDGTLANTMALALATRRTLIDVGGGEWNLDGVGWRAIPEDHRHRTESIPTARPDPSMPEGRSSPGSPHIRISSSFATTKASPFEKTPKA